MEKLHPPSVIRQLIKLIIMFFPFDCIDLSYIIIAFFWHLLRLGSFWYWRSIKCYTFLEAMIHLGLIFIILHYIIHIYIYIHTLYIIYIYMYIYIYVYIYICIYLHHMFSITFSMWLAGAFLVRASVGRWVAAWLLLRSFRQNFISGGGYPIASKSWSFRSI